MDKDRLKEILISVKSGGLGVMTALERLKDFPYEDAGFAKIDHHRKIRRGHSEVVYCEGKRPEQVKEIFLRMSEKNDSIIGTRASKEVFERTLDVLPGLKFHEVPNVMEYSAGLKKRRRGMVVVATGGTSDIPVAEEAAVVLEIFGNRVKRLYDVGVAGIHRLFSNIKLLDRAKVVIAVAGMEGALPSVIAGLVNVPVIAVPTSIGYGASFGGIAALLAMLNSCASGVSVVNIDNGFGAACQAHMINNPTAR